MFGRRTKKNVCVLWLLRLTRLLPALSCNSYFKGNRVGVLLVEENPKDSLYGSSDSLVQTGWKKRFDFDFGSFELREVFCPDVGLERLHSTQRRHLSCTVAHDGDYWYSHICWRLFRNFCY